MTQQPPSRAADLLRQVRRLELVGRRNTVGALAGDYLTAIRGQGMIFHETRKYVDGESARHIDWNVTARLGEPYVKVHREERQREVILALDLSPSMHSGSQRVTKLELAVELAATLAVSAIDSGDRLGYVLFADRVLAQGRPEGGRRQLFVVLASILRHVGPWRREVKMSDPRTAIHAIESLGRGKRMIFLISDFIDHDIPQDLRYLRARHDVSLLHVYDPLELAQPSEAVAFAARSPEGDSEITWLRPGEAGSLDEALAILRRPCARLRLGLGSFSTAVPPRPALSRFMRQLGRGARRSR